jgi:hypothetical protein
LYVVDNTLYPPPADRHALRVYDIASNPTGPIELTAFETHGNSRDIVFPSGGPANRAWVLDDGEGAIAVDISNPAALVRLGHYYSPAILNGVDRAGNLLYVADAWNGFTILDVSNPSATPTVAGIFQTPVSAERVESGNYAIDVVGDRAYFTAGLSGFMVVDVSNPASPSLLFTDDPGSVWGAQCVSVRNNVAHVTFTFFASSGTWGYRTYDATTFAILAAPIVPDANAAPKSIALTDSGLLCTGARVPQIIDSSNPANPVLVNASAGPIESNGVAVDGDVRLLARRAGADPADGLYLHNISNPANPAVLALLVGGPEAVAVQNHRAYVLTGSGCAVYDISNPSQPQAIISLDDIARPHDVHQLCVVEPHLFITSGLQNADKGIGLLIVKGENLDPEPPSGQPGQMYWADSGNDAIKRAGLDGTGVETIVDALDGLNDPSGLVIDAVNEKLYFTSATTGNPPIYSILRSNLDGSSIEPVLQNLPSVIRLAVDSAGGKIYWCGVTQDPPLRGVILQIGHIWRANLDGTAVEETHDLNQLWPMGIALDVVGGKIYWSGAWQGGCDAVNRIQRSNLDGSNVEDLVNVGFPGGLAVDHDGGKVYWSERFCGLDAIRRANLDGSNPVTLIPFAQGIGGMAIDPIADKLYFTSGLTSITRCNLDASQLEPLITVGLNGPAQIAVQPAPILCPADVTGNGTVGIDDLLAVINNWGQMGPNPADVTGNGIVNIDDLLAVINAWGACK